MLLTLYDEIKILNCLYTDNKRSTVIYHIERGGDFQSELSKLHYGQQQHGRKRKPAGDRKITVYEERRDR